MPSFFIHPHLVSHLKIPVVHQKGEVALANGTVITTPGHMRINMRVDSNGRKFVDGFVVILPQSIADVIPTIIRLQLNPVGIPNLIGSSFGVKWGGC